MEILFVVLAGYGHVTPALGLVEELVGRGHRVRFATGVENARAVIAAGAEWVEVPALAPFRADGEVLAGWFRHYFAAMRAVYPVLLEHCRGRRPEVICYDATNWPGRIVAEVLGVRAVRCVPHLASNEVFRLGVPEAAHVVAEECGRFGAEFGVELDVVGTLDRAEATNLVFVPREFQPAGESFDGRFHFIGPLLGRRAEQEWEPRFPELPLLYVSLGSVMSDPEVYRACVAAFGDGTWEVAMTAQGVGEVPPTVVVQDWFPQLGALRHATAFVTHAGMNSTMEALQRGVPLIAVPQTPEQEANADRIQELGVGERLSDLDDLRAVVERVAGSGAVRRNVERMRAAIAAAGGAGRGADVITG
ncbi:macrolide family glycosyltransferase [Actinokineospora sp. NPDC004072]